ncbi:MAG: ACP S-malonyltransferase [Beijerinckiaceae bacterium]|nr:ACP S-malonyltransferase [Beijerinckiaceae bacterium]
MRAIVFPGQGSQHTGMGSDVFERFPELVATANAVLGFDIRDLCLNNPGAKLDKTVFTQPAVYVVSFLRYRAMIARSGPPEFVAGHSVGEYAALAAAEVFDFATGLRIVQRRGSLMGETHGGGLVAILGLDAEGVARLLIDHEVDGVEIANINSPAQVVVGGRKDRLQAFVEMCSAKAVRVVPLRVSGAFHTSQMSEAAAKFADFLSEIEFGDPKIPVMSNVTGRLHVADQIRARLALHMVKPVLWLQCVEAMLDAGVSDFVEAGTPPVLVPIISDIRKQFRAASPASTAERHREVSAARPLAPLARDFCKTFGCGRPAIAGSLGNGIAGQRLVRALAKARMLAFLDTEGLELVAVDEALAELSADEETKGRFGVGLYANSDAPDADEPLVDLFLKHDVRVVEAKGYYEPSPALLRYRDKNGKPTRSNRVIGHAATREAVSGLMLGCQTLSTLEMNSCLPASTHEPWADALCIDLHTWRSKRAGSLSLLQAALSWRDVYRASASGAPFFVGAAGWPNGSEWIKALLATSADFVVAGSIFLMAEEASLDRETQTFIRDGIGAYEDTPDWHLPELGSRSLSFVSDHRLARAADQLQALYAAPQATASDIYAIAREMPEPFATRVRDLAIDRGGREDPALIRARLRRGLRMALFPGVVACDASPMAFTPAMLSGAAPRNLAYGAAHLAEFLCPIAPASETQTEKRYA